MWASFSHLFLKFFSGASNLLHGSSRPHSGARVAYLSCSAAGHACTPELYFYMCVNRFHSELIFLEACRACLTQTKWKSCLQCCHIVCLRIDSPLFQKQKWRYYGVVLLMLLGRIFWELVFLFAHFYYGTAYNYS